MPTASPLFFAYLVSLLVPPLVLALDHFWLKRRLGLLRGFLISALGIFILISGTALLYDWHLHRVLAGFDLDGDGSFSGPEVSAEQSLALGRVANSLGRGLAPVLGGIFGLAWSGVFYAVVAIGH